MALFHWKVAVFEASGIGTRAAKYDVAGVRVSSGRGRAEDCVEVVEEDLWALRLGTGPKYSLVSIRLL